MCPREAEPFCTLRKKLTENAFHFFCVRSISAESKEHPHFFTTLKVTLEKIGALTFAASVICPSGMLTFLLESALES